MANNTVTRDAVDILVARLNELDGIAFARDAWENKAPENYGVAEVTGQVNALYADNHMIAQVFGVRVHLYITGGGNDKVSEVQAILDDAVDGYTLPSHEFLFDVGKNHWTWDCTIIGPLQWEEVVEDG